MGGRDGAGKDVMEGEVLPGSSRGTGGDVGLILQSGPSSMSVACVSVACVRWGLQALVRGEERRDSTPRFDSGLLGLGEGAGVSCWQTILLAASLWV